MMSHAIEYRGAIHHSYSPHVADVDDRGRTVVDGCVPSPGMTGRILSRPWREVRDVMFASGGETMAILADGTPVAMGSREQCLVHYVARGEKYESIMAAALALTPA